MIIYGFDNKCNKNCKYLLIKEEVQIREQNFHAKN